MEEVAEVHKPNTQVKVDVLTSKSTQLQVDIRALKLSTPIRN